MEEAIEISMVEVQSYIGATATAYYKPPAKNSYATPMKLGNADVVCYNSGKRGDMMARCFAKLVAGAQTSSKKNH